MAKSPNSGTPDSNEVKTWLTVDVLDAVKDGDEWVFTVTAHAGTERNQNYAHCPLVVFLNREVYDVGGDAETDDHGNYKGEVRVSKPGNYLLGVGCPGVNISAHERKRVVAEKAAAKKPHTLKVEPIGSPGQQKLFIIVTDEDGKPTAGVIGTIIDGNDVREFETNIRGTYVHQMNFTEHERLAEVHVGAHNWNAPLLGAVRRIA